MPKDMQAKMREKSAHVQHWSLISMRYCSEIKLVRGQEAFFKCRYSETSTHFVSSMMNKFKIQI